MEDEAVHSAVRVYVDATAAPLQSTADAAEARRRAELLLAGCGGLTRLLAVASVPCSSAQRQSLQRALSSVLRLLPSLSLPASTSSKALTEALRCLSTERSTSEGRAGDGADSLPPFLPLLLLTVIGEQLTAWAAADGRLSAGLYVHLLDQPHVLPLVVRFAAAEPSLHPSLAAALHLQAAVVSSPKPFFTLLLASLFALTDPHLADAGSRAVVLSTVSCLTDVVHLCTGERHSEEVSEFAARLLHYCCSLLRLHASTEDAVWWTVLLRASTRLVPQAMRASRLKDALPLIRAATRSMHPFSPQAVENDWLLCDQLKLVEAVAKADAAAVSASTSTPLSRWCHSNRLHRLLHHSLTSRCSELVRCALVSVTAIAVMSSDALLFLTSQQKTPAPSLIDHFASALLSPIDELQLSALRGLSAIFQQHQHPAMHSSDAASDDLHRSAVAALHDSVQKAIATQAATTEDLLHSLLQSPFEQTRLAAQNLLRSLSPANGAPPHSLTSPASSSSADFPSSPPDDVQAAHQDPAPVNALIWPSVLSRCLRLLRDDAEVRLHRLPTSTEKFRLGGGSSTVDLLHLACKVYGARPAYAHLGTTLSYGDLWVRVERVAAGLASEQGMGLRRGTMVGLYGSSSIDWVVLHYALMYLGCTTAPLQLSNSDEDLRHCLQLTDVTVLACEEAHWARKMQPLLESRSPDLRLSSIRILLFTGGGSVGALSSVTSPQPQSGERSVLTLRDVEALGRQVKSLPSPTPVPAEHPVLVLYTSGSTGKPKACVVTERFWSAVHLVALDAQPPWPAVPRIALNYLPLSHNSGLVHLSQTLMNGGLTHFPSSADFSTFLPDLRRVAPTHLILVPRISSMLHQHYLTLVQQATLSLGAGAEDKDTIAAAVRLRIRQGLLGHRLLFILIGTAPTDDRIWLWLSHCFDVAVHHVYGTTESWPAILADQRVDPRVVLAHQLVPVPGMSYSPLDRPNPRGELWLHLRNTAGGYYRDEAATAALNSDHWFRTGDIVEAMGRQRLVWVDRKTAIVKLAQGEFVAVSSLEQAFTSGSRLVQQMFIYANSLQSFLLAVIVPADAAVTAEQLREELLRVGVERQLQPWEVPKDFIVETSPFSTQNGLLTESNKPARQQLKARYGEQLEALYAKRAIDPLRTNGHGHAKPPPTSLSTPADKSTELRQALCLVFSQALQVDLASLPASSHAFLQLGGDSITAVQTSELLRLELGIDVPVTTLLDSSASLDNLIHRIVAQHQPDSGGAEATATVKPAVRSFVDDAEFLIRSSLQPSYSFPAPPIDEQRLHAFLTGGTGFLGIFILQRLLLTPSIGQVSVLVRAPTPAEALARLKRTASVYQCWVEEAASRVRVVCGDLERPRLGVGKEEWARLSRDVDVVIHNGAAVHWLYPYASLRASNVLSAMDCLALATEGRVKRFTFVSSVSALTAAAYLQHSEDSLDADSHVEGVSEDDPMDAAVPHLTQGYGQSKWVVERVLWEARRRGMPVSVVRPCYILGDSATGATNPSDFIWRLVKGCIQRGCALHLPSLINACPVDYVAHVVTAAALHAHVPTVSEGGREPLAVYHLHQPLRLRFEDLFEVVRDCGYPLKRMGYEEWRGMVEVEGRRGLNRDDPLLPLLHFVLDDLPRSTRSIAFDDRHTRALLSRMRDTDGKGSSLAPPLDRQYLSLCLRYLAQVGFLSATMVDKTRMKADTVGE